LSNYKLFKVAPSLQRSLMHYSLSPDKGNHVITFVVQ